MAFAHNRPIGTALSTEEHRQALRAERTAFEHVETYLERNTTLPLGPLRMEQEVLKVEEGLAGNLCDCARLLQGAIRAAELLGADVLPDLTQAQERVRAAETKLVERRAGDA